MSRTLSRVTGPASLVGCAVALVASLAAPVAGQDAAPPPLKVGQLTISGYIQADAIVVDRSTPAGTDDTEPPGGFVVPRARLGVSGDITSKMSWALQGDFANLTNDGRVLRDAYLQFPPPRSSPCASGRWWRRSASNA